jgi:hypothetical protein
MKWSLDKSTALNWVLIIFLQGVNETTLSDYFFEMTTTSFRIDNDGKLIVNQRNLDRDPPNENKLSFQVRPLKSAQSMLIHFPSPAWRVLGPLWYWNKCTNISWDCNGNTIECISCTTRQINCFYNAKVHKVILYIFCALCDMCKALHDMKHNVLKHPNRGPLKSLIS